MLERRYRLVFALGIDFDSTRAENTAQADMIESREGRDGGYRLKKNACDITLAEVYSILQVHSSISDSMLDAATGHCFAEEIKESFVGILSEIEDSTLKILESRTIADIAQ